MVSSNTLTLDGVVSADGGLPTDGGGGGSGGSVVIETVFLHGTASGCMSADGAQGAAPTDLAMAMAMMTPMTVMMNGEDTEGGDGDAITNSTTGGGAGGGGRIRLSVCVSRARACVSCCVAVFPIDEKHIINNNNNNTTTTTNNNNNKNNALLSRSGEVPEDVRRAFNGTVRAAGGAAGGQSARGANGTITGLNCSAGTHARAP